MKRKVVFPFQEYSSIVCEEARQMLLKAGFEIAGNTKGRVLDRKEQKELLRDAFAVVAGTESYDAEMLSEAKELKVIVRFGVGLDNFDLPVMRKRGIKVGICTNENAVAEFALSLMLGIMKNIPRYDTSVREGAWDRYPMREMKGKVMGLIGFGRIGKRLAGLLGAFETEILVYDPYLDIETAEKFCIQSVPLDELLKRSDIISLHVPLTSQTKYLINRDTIGQMRKGVYLVNTSRGGVVDEAALCEGLESGKIAGAGLDVFEEEPPSPENPLLKFPNVVLAPHVASLSYENTYRAGMICAESIIKVLEGGEPLYPIL